MDKNLMIKNNSESRRDFLLGLTKLIGGTAIFASAANLFTSNKINAETNTSEPFVGQIIQFAGNFAPRGWAFCDGQLLAVSQNDALFSLLGTIYGGDGRTTFGLPDLRGRVPIHAGTGPGLSPRRLGSKGGEERVTLTRNQVQHNHSLNVNSGGGNMDNPSGNYIAANSEGIKHYSATNNGQTAINTSIGNTGGSQPHTNLMPTLCINFCIALFGIYPSRY